MSYRNNKPTVRSKVSSKERPWYLWEDRDDEGELRTRYVTYTTAQDFISGKNERLSDLNEL